MAQTDAILNYVIKYGKITAKDAVNDLDCYRLAARIYDLRRRGADIKSRLVSKNNKHYSVYYL